MSFEAHQKDQLQHQVSHDGHPEITSQVSSLAVKKRPLISIAKYPNFPNRQLSLIEDRHQAPDFTYYLKVFLMAFTMKQILHQRLDVRLRKFRSVGKSGMWCGATLRYCGVEWDCGVRKGWEKRRKCRKTSEVDLMKYGI